jgi:hypothetical protein
MLIYKFQYFSIIAFSLLIGFFSRKVDFLSWKTIMGAGDPEYPDQVFSRSEHV